MGRLLCVSDIHGYYTLLEKLMRYVQYDPLHDTLVVCGDSIDRGPESAKVMEWFMPGHYGERAIVLTGNHEMGLFDLLSGKMLPTSYCNSFMGGTRTIQSYLNLSDLELMTHLDFIGRLRLFYRQDGFIFVHAGLSPHKRVEYQNQRELTIEHADYYLKPGHFIHTKEKVIFGHTPTNIIRAERHEPIPETSYVWYDTVHRNKVGIDCGNKNHKRLCCLDVTNGLEYYVGFYEKDMETRKSAMGFKLTK